jgi:hypothetical protein
MVGITGSAVYIGDEKGEIMPSMTTAGYNDLAAVLAYPSLILLTVKSMSRNSLDRISQKTNRHPRYIPTYTDRHTEDIELSKECMWVRMR